MAGQTKCEVITINECLNSDNWFKLADFGLTRQEIQLLEIIRLRRHN